MKRNKTKTYLFWILSTLAVGAFSGWLTREGTSLYSSSIAKPPLSPPAIVFPIVWTVLYFLMGIGAARVSLSPASPARTKALGIYLLQLGFNFFWSIIFFSFGAYGAALVWLAALWLLIVLMILTFYRADITAALLQLPYLLWVTFAAWLNFGVWVLNK